MYLDINLKADKIKNITMKLIYYTLHCKENNQSVFMKEGN